MKELKRPWAAIFGLVFLALSCGLVFGQSLTGNLKGTVTDSDGLALPGATVTVESPNLLGGPRVSQTDENGKYRFMGLDSGAYTVMVEMDGFNTETRKEQVISVGALTTIDISLKLAGVAEQMIVTGQTPVVDKEKSGVQHNVSQQLLTDIPIARQYQSIIAMLPGVKGGSNPNVHGESSRNNQYLVDGVDTTDPVTGTFGMNFTFEAIQDIQYSTAGYLPEYGQVLGVVTNIVTKSGGNEIHGGVNFNTFQPGFRSEHSEEIKQEEVNKTEDYEISSIFGGPVKKDKIWYFGSFSLYDRDTTQEAVPYSDTVRVYYWLGKLSSQINANNRFVFQAFGDPYDRDGESMGTARTKEANPNRKQGGAKISGNWTWAVSPNSFIETRTYYNKQVLDLKGVNGDVLGEYDVDITFGDTTDPYITTNWGNQGSVFATNKSINRRFRKQFEADYSHLLEAAGDHEIKAGVEVEFANSSLNTGGGWKQLSQTWINAGFLNGWQPTNAPWDGTRNYSAYLHEEGKESESRKRVTFFAQDKWNPAEKLTINYGLRVDDTIAENDVKEDILNFTTFSPRGGFSYDLLGDGKTVLRGSVGRYYENPALSFPGAFNQNQKPYIRYMYNWATHDFDIPRAMYGGPSGYVIAYDIPLKSPYKNEFTIGAEREVIPNFSVGLDFIRGKTKDILEDIELNWIWQEVQDDVWMQLGLLDHTVPNWVAVDTVDGTTQVIFALTNPPEAERDYKGLELTFNKRFSDNWQLMGSYTWSKAKGSVEDAFTAFADSPQEFYNRYGFLSHDRTHEIVLNGSYHLPFGIRLGTRMQFNSGAPFTFTYRDGEDAFKVYLVPNGAEAPFAFDVMDRNGKVWKSYAKGDALRQKWFKNVDLRAEKSFKLGQGEFGVYLDFFNVFNWSDLRGFGSNAEHIGDDPGFQGPRTMEFLTRYTF